MIRITDTSSALKVQKFLAQEFYKEKYKKIREDLEHFDGKLLLSFDKEELFKLFQEDGIKLYNKLHGEKTNGKYRQMESDQIHLNETITNSFRF